MELQIGRFGRVEEEHHKLKNAYSSLETEFDDIFGERDGLLREIDRMKQNEKVTADETLLKI